VPTYRTLPRFWRDHAKLTAEQKKAFRVAVELFIEGLKGDGGFHPSLRVHRVHSTTDVWSMTWGEDGRATFEYGAEVQSGEAHVVWRRIGTHSIYRNP